MAARWQDGSQDSHEVNAWIWPRWQAGVYLIRDADSCKKNLQEASEGNQEAKVLIHHEKQSSQEHPEAINLSP